MMEESRLSPRVEAFACDASSLSRACPRPGAGADYALPQHCPSPEERITYGEHMDDSEIVAAIATGDPAGLSAAYDKYAAGVYGYCHWMLREPAHAASALVETFATATAELGRLKDPIAARALLYTTARYECHRQLGAAGAGVDSPTMQAPDDRQFRRNRQQGRGLVRRATAGRDTAPAGAASVGFRPLEQEASELSVRHGLAEVELAAVLDVSWQEAHNLAAHGREHLVPPSRALLGPVSPELRQRVLRRAAASAARGCGGRGVSPARSAVPAGWHRLGTLIAWPRIRANPGAATAIAVIAAWAVAAVSAVFITVTGMNPARAPATQTKSGTAAATSPAVGHRNSRSSRASASPSAGPATGPSHADAVPPTTTLPSSWHLNQLTESASYRVPGLGYYVKVK
jgi:DNA-directed RNA polymerase specialized sigma24 family protein